MSQESKLSAFFNETKTLPILTAFCIIMLSVFAGQIHIINEPLLWALNLAFTVFFLFTFRYIIKRRFLFAFYYLFLFIYTIGTQVSYLLYPTRLSVFVGHQYYGLEPFFYYIVFVFLSFIAIFILFAYLDKIWPRRKFIMIKQSNSCLEIILPIVVLMQLALILYMAFPVYSSLNYSNAPDLLKSNKVFFYSFYFYPITLLILFIKIQKSSKAWLQKGIYSFLFLISLVTFLAITIKSGQKMEMAIFIVGFLSYLYLSSSGSLLRGKRLYIIAGLLVAFFIFFSIINLWRFASPGVSEMAGLIVDYPDILFSYISSPEWLLLQDYSGPSLFLVTSIREHLIIPMKVLGSNFFNLFILTNYPSIAEIAAKHINPDLGKGQSFAYYFLTEGYNLMGWWGILYDAIIFCFGIFLWQSIAQSNNHEFNIFITSVLCMFVFDTVRGQSALFVKSTYMLLIPAIGLYLASNKLRLNING